MELEYYAFYLACGFTSLASLLFVALQYLMYRSDRKDQFFKNLHFIDKHFDSDEKIKALENDTSDMEAMLERMKWDVFEIQRIVKEIEKDL
jgi:hypothetical protein